MPFFVVLIVLLLALTVLYACCLVFWETLDNTTNQGNNQVGVPVMETVLSEYTKIEYMLNFFLKRLIIEAVVVSINLVVFYILLLQSIELSAKEGVRLLTIYVLWKQECPSLGQSQYCELLEESLRLVTGIKAILDHTINLGTQVLFHLITLELLDEGVDIILSIIIILTSRPMFSRVLPQRYVG